jgi:hypothetical protein
VSPGDDIRRLSIEGHGKSDRFFIKEYREATKRGRPPDASSSASTSSGEQVRLRGHPRGVTAVPAAGFRGPRGFTQKIDLVVPPGSAAISSPFSRLEDTVLAETSGAILQELAASEAGVHRPDFRLLTARRRCFGG